MTTKERIIQRIERLDEAHLLKLEQEIAALAPASPLSVSEELRLWRELAGTLSDPEDLAIFETAARRRPLFKGRAVGLELEP